MGQNGVKPGHNGAKQGNTGNNGSKPVKLVKTGKATKFGAGGKIWC